MSVRLSRMRAPAIVAAIAGLSPNAAGAEPECMSHADVIARAAQSVVTVRVLRAVNPDRHRPLPFPESAFNADVVTSAVPEREPASYWERMSGSAVVISGGAVMLTNNHVIEDAVDVEVTGDDGVSRPAEVVGADPATDIAVIRARDGFEHFTPIDVGDSADVRLGDAVFAIGNPFGVGQTVTAGIVSAVHRSGLGILDIEAFIQTDAAINPGSSGGALIDSDGRLIGISTALLSWTGGNQGIGFAVPIDLARSIGNTIIRRGTVERGWLGATLQDLTPPLARALGVKSAGGALIASVVPGGPAAAAGLSAEEVITAIDSTRATSASVVINALTNLRPGKTVRLQIDGERGRRVVKLTLARAPERPAQPHVEAIGGAQPLGIQLARIDDIWRTIYGIRDEVGEGLVVTAVEVGGAAALAGLRPGDVLQELDRRRIPSGAMLREAWSNGERDLLIRAVRRGRTIYVVLERIERPSRSGST